MKTYVERIGWLVQEVMTTPHELRPDTARQANDALRLMMWFGVDKALQTARGHRDSAIDAAEQGYWSGVIELIDFFRM